MTKTHRALIHWSVEQVTQGFPRFHRTIDPAWLPEARPPLGDGWSLVCDFESSPSVQGSPSMAQVQFMVDEAPHDRLRPGIMLQLFERPTRRYAQVEILD
jgi:hypothetical protein